MSAVQTQDSTTPKVTLDTLSADQHKVVKAWVVAATGYEKAKGTLVKRTLTFIEQVSDEPSVLVAARLADAFPGVSPVDTLAMANRARNHTAFDDVSKAAWDLVNRTRRSFTAARTAIKEAAESERKLVLAKEAYDKKQAAEEVGPTVAELLAGAEARTEAEVAPTVELSKAAQKVVALYAKADAAFAALSAEDQQAVVAARSK
jgi:hypothetical protein